MYTLKCENQLTKTVFFEILCAYRPCRVLLIYRFSLPHCWWEWKLVQPSWRQVWGFLKNLKTELPYDPEIPLLAIYSEKTIIRSDTCTSMSTTTLFYNCQDMEATKMSINRRTDKDAVHIYNGILLSHKQEWNNAICSNMDGPRDGRTE